MAVADTSFLIDWARFSLRDLLFRVFDTVWIPEDVLNEVQSERTLTWIADRLASGHMSLFPLLPEYRDRALRLVELSRRGPARGLDFPEAYCIAVAEDRGYVALSENGAAYAAQFLYTTARVWRAYEVLWELRRRGLVPDDVIHVYQEETRHKFPQRDVERWRSYGSSQSASKRQGS